jgi:DNA-binding response OmpR family regulator
MMPGMPVKEMVPKIKGAKIAFLTVVHVSDAEREELLAFKNIAGLIQKPFDIKELVEKVRGMIG